MYALNAQEAMKGDERKSRIDELGKYLGQFSRAEAVVSNKKGTQGVDFAFTDESGASGNFTLWTIGADGKQLRGFQQLQALMACMRVKNLAPTPTKVKKFDRDQNAVVEVVADCFPELMSKRVGLLLETEDYLKNNGDIGIKLALAASFEADTELMASEILNRKAVPAMLGKMVGTLRHRKLKGNSGGNSHPNAPGNNAGNAADPDDDIPF